MNYIVNSKILEEDFLSVKERGSHLLKKMSSKKVFVTGATGLVGSLIIRTLAYINETDNLSIQIYGLARSADKVKSIYGEELPDSLKFVYGEITDPYESYLPLNDETEKIDYVFHTACITTSKIMISQPVDTVMTAIDGTNQILRLAKERKAESVIYVSSMEMYGTVDKTDYCTESDLGFIDPLKIRSNYPEGKRMCENLCVAYSSQYEVPVKIARLSQTFGAGIFPWEGRVFAQFAHSVIDKTDIVLHTTGKSEGNYCYSSDMVLGLLTILIKGADGEAYNVVNEATHTTIADMAKLNAEVIANGEIKVVFDIPEDNKYGYAAETHLKLSGKKLEALGWTPEYNLESMYRRTIAFLMGE